MRNKILVPLLVYSIAFSNPHKEDPPKNQFFEQPSLLPALLPKINDIAKLTSKEDFLFSSPEGSALRETIRSIEKGKEKLKDKIRETQASPIQEKILVGIEENGELDGENHKEENLKIAKILNFNDIGEVKTFDSLERTIQNPVTEQYGRLVSEIPVKKVNFFIPTVIDPLKAEPSVHTMPKPTKLFLALEEIHRKLEDILNSSHEEIIANVARTLLVAQWQSQVPKNDFTFAEIAEELSLIKEALKLRSQGLSVVKGALDDDLREIGKKLQNFSSCLSRRIGKVRGSMIGVLGAFNDLEERATDRSDILPILMEKYNTQNPNDLFSQFQVELKGEEDFMLYHVPPILSISYSILSQILDIPFQERENRWFDPLIEGIGKASETMLHYMWLLEDLKEEASEYEKDLEEMSRQNARDREEAEERNNCLKTYLHGLWRRK